MEIKAALSKIDTLSIPEEVRKDLKIFVSQIVSFYKEDLLSIIAFGSSVTGDYMEKTSDLNLLVIYSDLNIADLSTVAGIARKWLRKRNFSPRFLSKRNLLNSAKYFQIDLLEMRDTSMLLLGEDLLKGLELVPANLHWQLSYEIKAMRARIKQQFWRTSGDPARIRRVLTERFTSLIHQSRALLFLMKKELPTSHRGIMDAAIGELGLNQEFVALMFNLKKGWINLNQKQALQAFEDMMEMIRTIDRHTEEVSL